MSTTKVNRGLVYDLPTRFFHGIFAGLFILAFAIAKLVDDDSPTYSWHMLAGLLLCFTVMLRLLWGFIGTRNARFSNFDLRPKSLIQYIQGILTGDKARWPGHNPASSWAAILMMGFALGLGVTGYLMASKAGGEDLEDIHEVLANGFFITAIVHVAGVVFHTLRHRELIGLAMIDGKKSDVARSQTIESAKPIMGILFLVLVAAVGNHLYSNYSSATRTLRLFGTTLSLGESEDEEKEGHEEGEEYEDPEDDDDD